TSRVVFMLMLATGILSMFVSDAAVAAMMIPIGMSLYGYVSKVTGGTESSSRSALASFLALGVVYASQAGGVGSIAGLPANAVVVGLVDSLTGRVIGWFEWMMVGVPLFLIEITCFYALLRYLFPFGRGDPAPTPKCPLTQNRNQSLQEFQSHKLSLSGMTGSPILLNGPVRPDLSGGLTFEWYSLSYFPFSPLSTGG
ncbi:anion permease, partial [Acidobacteria bacterium AH-259-D05]|nr:anion permease [Acidobacteria bacterium AH-259-D05]